MKQVLKYRPRNYAMLTNWQDREGPWRKGPGYKTEFKVGTIQRMYCLHRKEYLPLWWVRYQLQAEAQ